MPRRPCLTCPALAPPGRSRCQPCEQQHNRAKWQDNANRDPEYRKLRAAVAAQLPVPCALCGDHITHIGHDADALTLDHIVAWASGGTSEAANLRPAHKRCNSARGRGT